MSDVYTKAQLDAMTDGAADTVRAQPLSGPRAEYAAQVAKALEVQFPGIPELPRIVLACSQHIAALGSENIRSVVIVHILGEAALRIGSAT